MTRELMIACGRALYGDQWQSPLARALGINLRSIQRWAAGTYNPPDLRPQLAELLRDRSRKIDVLLECCLK